MEKKATYDFPAKRLYHAKLLEFIEPTLRHRKIKRAKVCCFPGHEGLEVLAVYDKLGIPRQNITGLEIDPKIADDIRKSVPGIHVVVADAKDFLASHTGDFDVINLDYQGSYNNDIDQTIRKIGRRKLIRSGGILATNIYGAREGQAKKDLYYLHSNANFLSVHMVDKAIGDHVPGSLSAPQIEGLPDQRSEALTARILQTYMVGTSRPHNVEYLRPPAPGLVKLLEDWGFTEEFYSDPKNHKLITYWAPFRSIVVGSTVTGLQQKYPGMGMTKRCWLDYLEYIYSSEEAADTVDKFARYEYPTKGGKMLADFFQFQRWPDEWKQRSLSFGPVVPVGNNSARAASINLEYMPQDLRNMLLYLNGPSDRADPTKFPEREVLGPGRVVRDTRNVNSNKSAPALPPTDSLSPTFPASKTSEHTSAPTHNLDTYSGENTDDVKELISKADAIELLKAGIPASEILETFGGLSKLQLAALKAHVTRGTYD